MNTVPKREQCAIPIVEAEGGLSEMWWAVEELGRMAARSLGEAAHPIWAAAYEAARGRFDEAYDSGAERR